MLVVGLDKDLSVPAIVLHTRCDATDGGQSNHLIDADHDPFGAGTGIAGEVALTDGVWNGYESRY